MLHSSSLMEGPLEQKVRIDHHSVANSKKDGKEEKDQEQVVQPKSAIFGHINITASFEQFLDAPEQKQESDLSESKKKPLKDDDKMSNIQNQRNYKIDKH